jgi:hypothetical protein
MPVPFRAADRAPKPRIDEVTNGKQPFFRLPWFFEEGCCALATFLVAFPLCYLVIGSNAYFAFALAGCFFGHAYLRRNKAETVVALIAGAAYAGLYFLLHGAVTQYFGVSLGMTGAFAGLGSLTVLAARLNYAPLEDRSQIREVLVLTALLPLISILLSVALSVATGLTPSTYDYVLYHLDRSLGIDTFAAARGVLVHQQLYRLCETTYSAFPLYIAVCLVLLHRRPSAWAFPWIVATLGVAGFAMYQICPAAGPSFRFAMFPKFAPPLAEVPLHAAFLRPTARNAMPSLHVGWTLLCWWNVRTLGRGMRLLAFFFLVTTAMATIVLGEHYAVDLIVAVPLCVAVQSAWNCNRGAAARILVTALATTMVLYWVMAARYGVLAGFPLPAIRLLAIGTLVASFLLHSWYSSRPHDPGAKNTPLTTALGPAVSFS